MRDAGFTDRDIWDIASVAAFYNMSNRLAAAADIRPNREYHYIVRERADPAPSEPGATTKRAASSAARPATPTSARRRRTRAE